jgi:osmoprotectant transport system substrate-binding protein
MSMTTYSVKNGLVALSAMAMLAAGCGGGGTEQGAAKATICVGGEFSTRPDGLPGLEKAYGFTFPAGDVTAVDEDSLVFTEVDGGRCTFGSITATDGRVGSLGLTVLKDDKGFFPPYNGSLNVRTEVLDGAPGIEELFDPITAALDDKMMIALNSEVDVEGHNPKDVARKWLDGHRDLIKAVDLSGKTFTVGSKEFTEQLVLGQLTKLVLEGAGATVTDQTGLVGSVTVREALKSAKIDLYWEYLGTGWVTYLGNTQAIPDPAKQYEAVRDADVANGITWLEPAPFNNTYAIGTTNEKAKELGITSISEIGRLIAG